MHVKTLLACRDNNLIFEKLLATDVEKDHALAPHYFTPTDDQTVRPLPFRLIEMGDDNMERELIVVYPDLNAMMDAGIFIGEYDTDGLLVDFACHRVDFRRAKWQSRKNYRIHAADCSQMKRVAKKHVPYGDFAISVSDIIPDGEYLILRGEAQWPSDSSGQLEIVCQDSSDLKVLSDQYVLMGESEINDGTNRRTRELLTSFSVRVAKTDSDLFIYAWNSSHPIRSSALVLPVSEQQRLRSPFDYILYNDASVDPTYPDWLSYKRPSPAEIASQKLESCDAGIKFHLLVAVERADAPELTENTITSVLDQSYENWVLNVLYTGVAEPSVPSDDRIRVVRATDGRWIASAEDLMAHEGTPGDYCMVLCQGSLLEPDALFEFWKAASSALPAAMYCDEGRCSGTDSFFHPILKPDFSYELLKSEDYISRSMLIRMPFAPSYDLTKFSGVEEQLYGMSLDVARRFKNIIHVPKVLLHHNTTEDERRRALHLPSYDAVVRSHMNLTEPGAVVDSFGGHTRITYPVPTDCPLVSIVIPSKDHIKMLDTCLKSILKLTTYPNYEVVVIENNSVEEATFSYYERLQSVHGDRVKVVRWEHEFNFSKIVNFGRKQARGSYLLLLNNDTELLTPDWLERLVGLASRPGIGAVGVKLYYPDDTIQHAGVCLSKAAGHYFSNLPRGQYSYLDYADVQREVSCVTAACLMSSMEAFDAVGGFDPSFTVAFNDVDYCLALVDRGYKIIYTPFVELYHYESVSRGRDDDPRHAERQIRSDKEWAMFCVRHGDFVFRDDPCSSPNVRGYFPDCQYFLIERFFEGPKSW